VSPEPTPPPFSGSDLRDRMANERTLLAWVRTAIALMAFGMAIAKFSLFLAIAGFESPQALAMLPSPFLSRMTGTAFILVGALVTLLGLRRTLDYGTIIDPYDRAPKKGVLIVVALALVALSVVLTVEVLGDLL
jgi:putative membrane protein